ncbi:MAG: class I SAM-dependent methyltransferase [Planctomycetes bacterium]|nr:class I SAM-dependent methyltransferase [Planctomycetota bacterium]
MSGQHHEHYDHYSEGMADRLDRGYGYVDRWINAQLCALLTPGARVLDLGCGFGSLDADLRRRGVAAVGVDLLPFCLQAGRARDPAARLVCGDATRLPFAPGSLDTVVLKDVLHHLYDEAPLDVIFAELERIGIRELVISDPNPNPLLLLGRRLIGHVDPVCSPRAASQLLRRFGFEVEFQRYGVVASMALSGGYVAPALVPGSALLWRPLMLADATLSRVANRAGLGRAVCWRYFLKARRV